MQENSKNDIYKNKTIKIPQKVLFAQKIFKISSQYSEPFLNRLSKRIKKDHYSKLQIVRYKNPKKTFKIKNTTKIINEIYFYKFEKSQIFIRKLLKFGQKTVDNNCGRSLSLLPLKFAKQNFHLNSKIYKNENAGNLNLDNAKIKNMPLQEIDSNQKPVLKNNMRSCSKKLLFLPKEKTFKKKCQKAENFVLRIKGFPFSEGREELNGNYVPIGSLKGRQFFCNRQFVYLFYKDGFWRLSSRLGSDQVIGYTRSQDLFGEKSQWNVVDEQNEFCTANITVRKINPHRKSSEMRKVTLTNWHFEPKIIATETYKRVALKFYGYLFKDNSRFETNFVARRLSSNQFLTIDGRLIRLTGKLDYNSCKQYFKKDEGKFLKLFELGLPENFMQIIELLI